MASSWKRIKFFEWLNWRKSIPICVQMYTFPTGKCRLASGYIEGPLRTSGHVHTWPSTLTTSWNLQRATLILRWPLPFGPCPLGLPERTSVAWDWSHPPGASLSSLPDSSVNLSAFFLTLQWLSFAVRVGFVKLPFSRDDATKILGVISPTVFLEGHVAVQVQFLKVLWELLLKRQHWPVKYQMT